MKAMVSIISLCLLMVCSNVIAKNTKKISPQPQIPQASQSWFFYYEWVADHGPNSWIINDIYVENSRSFSSTGWTLKASSDQTMKATLCVKGPLVSSTIPLIPPITSTPYDMSIDGNVIDANPVKLESSFATGTYDYHGEISHDRALNITFNNQLGGDFTGLNNKTVTFYEYMDYLPETPEFHTLLWQAYHEGHYMYYLWIQCGQPEEGEWIIEIHSGYPDFNNKLVIDEYCFDNILDPFQQGLVWSSFYSDTSGANDTNSSIKSEFSSANVNKIMQ